MLEHFSNKNSDFIKGYYIENVNLLDRLIDYHASTKTFPGVSYHNGHLGINDTVKLSTDCHLLDETLYKQYMEEITKCCDEYRKDYPHVDSTSEWGVKENILIQRYDPPNGNFNSWHHEGGSIEGSNRHLVFLTYLTNNNEGATEFFYQGKSFYPEKGLTIIFPTAFTHTHRGAPVKNSTKMIVTGWLSFME